jgi:CO dehydrogenase maturation factor
VLNPTESAVKKHLSHSGGIRIVITGKGGVGKTTITALLGHLFAQEGIRVLAVDGDPQQNLAVTMGILPQVAEKIVPVSQSTDYLREKTGAGPGISPGGAPHSES